MALTPSELASLVDQASTALQRIQDELGARAGRAESDSRPGTYAPFVIELVGFRGSTATRSDEIYVTT